MNNWLRASLGVVVIAAALVLVSRIHHVFFTDSSDTHAVSGAVLMDVEAIVIGAILLVLAGVLAIVGMTRAN